MATDLELDRVAGAVNALRPDWPVASLRTYLRSRHAGRAYADVAVALVAVAVDPASTTPARVEQPGPWWQATRAVGPGTYRPGPDGAPCSRDGHEHEPAATCRACRAEYLAGDEQLAAATRRMHVPDGWRDRAAEQLEARRILTRADLAFRALVRAGTAPGRIRQRAAASTLALVQNGCALEGDQRADVDTIRAAHLHLLLGRPVELDDRVVHGVVEVDPLDALPTPDPGAAGVDTREDTAP